MRLTCRSICMNIAYVTCRSKLVKRRCGPMINTVACMNVLQQIDSFDEIYSCSFLKFLT